MIALGEILAWPCLERGGSASDQQSKHRWEQPSNHVRRARRRGLSRSYD
jgi:hypothetical protein